MGHATITFPGRASESVLAHSPNTKGPERILMSGVNPCEPDLPGNLSAGLTQIPDSSSNSSQETIIKPAGLC